MYEYMYLLLLYLDIIIFCVFVMYREGSAVGVVYYRAGYTPNDYITENVLCLTCLRVLHRFAYTLAKCIRLLITSLYFYCKVLDCPINDRALSRHQVSDCSAAAGKHEARAAGALRNSRRGPS